MATVSGVIQMESYEDSGSSNMSANSSNGQMTDLCTPCPNTTYSKDKNEGKSDSEIVVETVTSTEKCEFDELWSMDPSSVKLKGISLIQDEKFDFNISEELDISLESVEAVGITSSSTSDSPDDWVFPKLNNKTTTIEEGGVGSGGLPGAPTDNKDCGSWVFPIKTTPTKDSALSGKEPTSCAKIPDRKQAEDWVFSKMFQLDTGGSESCSDAEKPLDVVVMGTDPFSGLNEDVLARLRDTAPSPPPCSSSGGVPSADVGTSDDHHRSAGNGGRGVATRGPNRASKVKGGANRNSAVPRSSGVKSSRISKIAQPVATTTGIPRVNVNSKSKLSKIAPKKPPVPCIKPTLLPRTMPSKRRVPVDISNKLGAKPTFKSKLAKPVLPGSRLNGKVAGRPETKALVAKRNGTFIKSELTFVKSEHQTSSAHDAGKCNNTTRDLQNAECCAPVVVGVARVVQSTPKESRTSEQVVRGETVTKCLRQVDITPIPKVAAITTTTTIIMSPPKIRTKAKCGDENSVQLNETHCVSQPRPTNAPSASNLLATPKSRVGRRSLIPTPHGQKDGEKLDLTSPIKYNASTQAKRKSLFGKAVTDENALRHVGMSPQLEGNKENPSLPVVKKSGLQRPSKVRGGRKGEENVGVMVPGAVRGGPQRRGPFRPLNGLASRRVEALSSPVYSNYAMEDENLVQMLVSRPKVVHSPVDKENIPTTPLSKWSPINKKKHNLDQSCHRCTKRLN